MQQLSLAELEHAGCRAEVTDCHRQIWKHGSLWLGNRSLPRATDGLIVVCSRIRAIFRAENEEPVSASQGDVVYIPRGTRYTVEFRNGGFDPDTYTVNFTLWNATGDAVCLGKSLCLLTSGAAPECRHAASELRLLCLDPRGSRLRRQARFFDLLAALCDSVVFHAHEHAPIYKGVRLLINEWDRNEHMDRYAAVCKISESSFYQHFKEWAGVSPNEYRINMRISAAKSMLRNSSISVREIAEQVGFPDPYYFSRCFRRAVGLSPRAYREKQKNTDFSTEDLTSTE
ncbi:MAG: helix-turn-helix transcriptional regulator [Ruminococcaceae bacterium]|nr:helix-turn-helix transcriptional regulator [Oscillospiraceae bacterium]